MKKKIISISLAASMIIGNVQGVEYIFADEVKSNITTNKQVDEKMVKEENSFKKLSALSSDETLTYGDYRYTINDSKITITGYTGSDENLVVPDEIDGLKVTEIESWSFKNCSNLKSIKIPKSVTSMSNSAFKECDKLTDINVDEDNLTYKSIDGCLYTADGNKLVLVPGGKTELTISKDAREIGDYACRELKNLISIKIPGNIEQIGERAFLDCNKLESVEIEAGVKIIKECAFQDCTSLNEIKLSEGLETIERNALENCENLENVEIPEGVKKIDCGLFSGCTKLKSVKIPSTVGYISYKTILGTEIHDTCSFERCINLEEVIVSENNPNYCSIDGVLYSKDKSQVLFYPEGKPGGYTIEIPEGTTTIGFYEFVDNKKVDNIIIPDTVKEIGNSAFSGCSSLKSIKFPKDISYIRSSAFRNSGLESIQVPNCKLGVGVFEFCENLKDVTISEGLSKIAHGTFFRCTSLEEIYLPKSISYINEGAFEDCNNLSRVVIENGDTVINEAPEEMGLPFSGCDKLTIYSVPGSKVEEYAKKYNISFKSIESIQDSVLPVNGFKVLRNSPTSLVLSWLKGSNADGYELYRSTSENGQYVRVKTISDANILTNASTGLQSSTSYYYKIRAYKVVDGKKIYSKYTSLKATTKLDKLLGIKVINSTEKSLKIGWDKVDRATGYEVFRSTSENSNYVRVKTITDNNTTQIVSTNLKEDTTYYYRVKAYIEVDGQKIYSSSPTLKATTLKPMNINELKMVANSTNSIRISWKQVDDVDGYEVFRATEKNGKCIKIKTITNNTTVSIASPNLQSGTTYYYKVRAYETVGENKQYGKFSLIETSTKPGTVNGLKTISITDKSIKIGWNKINTADGYEIFRANSENGSYVKVGTTNNLYYTSTKVMSGQTYYYKVKAYKLIGTKKTYGSYSNVLKIIAK